MSAGLLKRHIPLELLIVVVAMSGCGKQVPKGGGGVSHPAPANTAAVQEAAPLDIRAGKPDVEIDATKLFQEYKADRPGLRKYSGKIIQLSGQLKHVRVEALDSRSYYTLAFVVKNGEDRDWVICHLQDKSEWSKLGNTQEVTVKGEYDPTGMYGGPVLKDCVVVKAGPETQLQYDAEMLAAEYVTDPKQLLKKCDGRTIIVSGEILEVGNEGINPCIDLKGQNKIFVRCLFDGKRDLGDFAGKKGDKVKIFAEFQPAVIQRMGQVGLYISHILK